MADELVLNFSQPAASSSTPARSRPAARSKAHGGRWTDRAKERKRSQIEARKASRGGGAQPNAGAQHAQATKRSREGAGADDAGGGAAAPAAKRERTAGGGTGAPGGKRRLDMTVGPYGKKQYISSLFTAEGLPSTADSSNTSSTPIVPARPSNAPLTSVPSTQNEGDAAADEGQADEGPDRAPELSKLGLMRELVAGLAGKLGITGPTACQAGAIPRLIPQSQVKKGKGKGRAPASDFAHDAILRAQTGSGKTLTFLLPMLQDLLTLPPSLLPPSSSAPSSSSGPDRSIGTLALILAPTRELASQIHTVLSSLLSSLPSSSPNPNRPFTISPRALTAGLLVGGANRTHEKRRLRKGCPIVVATPGRLLDHLKTTEAFRLAGEPPRVKDGAPKGRPGNANATALGVRGGGAGAGAGSGKVGLRWLIVDECDRLMDLGFEEQMKGILEELARRSPSSASSSPAYGALSTRRRTILCSATASEGVDRLAGMAISDEDDGKGMVVVGAREDVKVREPERKDLTAPASVAGTKRGSEAVEDGADEDRAEDDEDEADEEDETVKAESAALALPSGFTPPSQLQHNYIIVPPKLRFVTLVALLRKLLVRASSANGGRGMKVLVFMSCTDAVDFWWKALGKMKMGTSSTDDADDEDEDAEEDDKAESSRLVSLHPLISGTPIYRLHGSLPLQTRLASLSAFSSPYTIEDGKRKGSQTDAGVLLCTSVAARGLDVKNVGCVVQVDAPTEGGVTEYVHRVGRTARAGAEGTAYSFILPSETAYTSFLENGINASSASAKGAKKVRMGEVGVEQVLREGYGGEGREYETRATDVQMGFERWVNASEETAALARKAFQAHIRAYATHPSSEKHIFNTKSLHLGHLAKSFGMREAPGSHAASSGKKGGNKKARVSTGGAKARDDDGGFEVGPRKRKAMDAEQRMKKLMRGPQALGASEFHIAGSDMLEGIVKRK